MPGLACRFISFCFVLLVTSDGRRATGDEQQCKRSAEAAVAHKYIYIYIYTHIYTHTFVAFVPDHHKHVLCAVVAGIVYEISRNPCRDIITGGI